MKQLIENTDGLFFKRELLENGCTKESVPFTKTETKTRVADGKEETFCIYDGCLEQGYDLILIPQAEKDAHEAEQVISQAVAVVQGLLDSTAQSKGYDNINAIAKYMGYDNQFRAECEALGAWCAACWTKCYELQSGGVMPSDLLAEMPELGL